VSPLPKAAFAFVAVVWAIRAKGVIAMPDAQELADMVLSALNDHDLDRALRLYSPDAVFVSPFGVAEGREQIGWYYEHFYKAFPDIRMTVWQRVTCGDLAFTEWTLTGTHTGPFVVPGGGRVDGTGHRMTVRGCSMFAVEEGQIISHREYYDQLELYAQLGFSLGPEATS
jgi:steroid delta-isomerase-like uncharacterized protein